MQVLFPLMVKVDQQIQRYSFSKSHFNLSPPLVLRGFGFTLRKNPLFPPRIFTRKHFWPGITRKELLYIKHLKVALVGPPINFIGRGSQSVEASTYSDRERDDFFPSMSEQGLLVLLLTARLGGEIASERSRWALLLLQFIYILEMCYSQFL
ncbi:hypothetical protein CDAR_179801 [Caerostris darwini]|uniref:Uncharacterized protein n=1 Tax=Caerostris darwini TaxID=1538125 RepID=A0AAV4RKF2_9ARAC|nr:hypothetical protein CDAR_179801 [Caerostris darwini]